MKMVNVKRMYIFVVIFALFDFLCILWIKKGSLFTLTETTQYFKDVEENVRESVSEAAKNDTGLKCLANSSNFSCQNLKFSRDPLPKTALFSFPGSGNTWLRHLFQQITGIYTGSVYFDDDDLKKHGFPGEGHAGQDVVAIKTHNSYLLMKLYDRAIVIMRNPLYAIYASFQQGRFGHTAVITEENLRKNETLKWQLTNSINDQNNRYGLSGWFRDNLSALKQYSKEKMLIVHYENLKTDLRRELIRIFDFLDIPVDQKIMDCAICNSEGNFHRQKKSYNPYTKADNFVIAVHVKAMNETLKEICGLSCAMPYSVDIPILPVLQQKNKLQKAPR